MDVTVHVDRNQADAPDDESFRIWVMSALSGDHSNRPIGDNAELRAVTLAAESCNPGDVFAGFGLPGTSVIVEISWFPFRWRTTGIGCVVAVWRATPLVPVGGWRRAAGRQYVQHDNDGQQGDDGSGCIDHCSFSTRTLST